MQAQPDILASIMAERRVDVETSRTAVSEGDLRERAAGRTHHSLVSRLRSDSGLHVISEIKKASPSAGLLRPNYDPGKIAAAYEQAGAAGISVLTEPRHFLGSADHLRAVRQASSLPLLRKDFMCDPYQVCEAAAWGADVILLIVAALAPSLMLELYACARELGLDVLVESHSREELERALTLDEAIIGVNSRNLKTLTTDLAVARELAAAIPGDRLAIAESGIRHRSDVDSLHHVGYKGFLIGEMLMKGESPGETLAQLLRG